MISDRRNAILLPLWIILIDGPQRRASCLLAKASRMPSPPYATSRMKSKTQHFALTTLNTFYGKLPLFHIQASVQVPVLKIN